MNIFEGKLNAKDSNFAIIVSRFNSFITSQLLDGALNVLTRQDVKQDNISLFYVPGAFEIPVMSQKLALLKKYDAIICLGALIRGSTPHFDYISSAVTSGISQVALNHTLPITLGVITVDTIEQAIERSGTKSGNKGADAAQCAIEMVNIFSQEI